MCFGGTVAGIKKGSVDAGVVIHLKGGSPVTASITNGVVENLGLKKSYGSRCVIVDVK